MEEKQTPRLIPIPGWPKHHEYPSPSQIRWMLYKNINGFRDECAVQIGRRVLIDEAAFFRWVNKQQQEGGVR